MSVESALAALSSLEAPAAPPSPAPAEEAPKAQAGAIEAPKAEEKPQEAPKESAATKFAQAAKAEKRLQEERAKLKAERDQLAAEKAKIEQARLRPDEYVKDPLRALRDAFPGMDPNRAYEALTQAILQGGKASPELETVAVKREVETLREQLAAFQKAQEENRAKAEAEQAQKALEGFKQEIKSSLEKAGDAFELTNLYGQHGLVYDTIRQYHEETGEMMSVEDAAKKVEAYLEGEVEKVLKAKKFQAKLAPKPAPTPSLGQTGSPSPAPAKGKRTEAERVAAALAAIEAMKS